MQINAILSRAVIEKYDVDDYRHNVLFAGSGETGRIMGMFMQHKIIEAAGTAEIETPFYSKRMWDDRGSWMAAPNLKTVADIGMTVTAAILAPGVGNLMLNVALNMVDDAIFTAADVSNGADAGAAFGALAKKGMTSFVTGRIGAGFASDGGLLNSTMLGKSVIGTTMTKGLEITSTNVASSAINSLDFGGMTSGGDFFNERNFMEGAFGKNAMAGVMSGMAGTFATQALNNSLSNTSFTGFSQSHQGNIGQFTSTMGGLASTAVTYGMTGNASINLLNTSMLSAFGLRDIENKGPVSVGLFELGFGKGGVRGSIGMGGTDLNVAKLAGSLSGMNVIYQNHRISEYAATHTDLNAVVAMRALYSFGDRTGRDTFNDLLKGKANLNVDGNLDREARTVTDDNGIRQITVKSLGTDVDSSVFAGIVLQHESYRDGYIGSDQKTETEDAVTGHTEMAIKVLKDGIYSGAVTSNENLRNDIIAYSQGAKAFSQYVDEKYDSSADYWKVIKDKNGKVEAVLDDKKYDTITYVDTDGKDLGSEQVSGSLSGQIAKSTGEKQSQPVINTIMMNSGLGHTGKEGTTWFVSDAEKQKTLSEKYSKPASTNYSVFSPGRIGLQGLEQYGSAMMVNAEAIDSMVTDFWILFGEKKSNPDYFSDYLDFPDDPKKAIFNLYDGEYHCDELAYNKALEKGFHPGSINPSGNKVPFEYREYLRTGKLLDLPPAGTSGYLFRSYDNSKDEQPQHLIFYTYNGGNSIDLWNSSGKEPLECMKRPIDGNDVKNGKFLPLPPLNWRK